MLVFQSLYKIFFRFERTSTQSRASPKEKSYFPITNQNGQFIEALVP
jgi:hypothetical protein